MMLLGLSRCEMRTMMLLGQSRCEMKTMVLLGRSGCEVKTENVAEPKETSNPCHLSMYPVYAMSWEIDSHLWALNKQGRARQPR